MREQAVVADRDPDARQQVAGREQTDVRPADPRVPQEADRGDQPEERHRHPDQVGDLVRAAHS